MNYEELKQRASVIRDENQEHQNTAQRVGSLLMNIIEGTEEEFNKRPPCAQDLKQLQTLLTQLQTRLQSLTTKTDTHDDKLKLIVDFGEVSTSGVAEERAIEYAGKPEVALIHYITGNGQVGIIRQYYNNQGSTLQYLTLNGTEFVRTVQYDSGMKSAWRNINRTSLVYKMLYNSESRMLSFHDPIHDEGFGGITLPLAGINGSGLMDSTDKNNLGAILYLGHFSSVGEAEDAAIPRASNRGIVIMHYKVDDGRSGMFLQSFSNSSATIQFHYLSGRRYVRQVSWGTGSVGSWADVTGCERIRGLVYDESECTIKFEDALGDRDWGGVKLPIASKDKYVPGLMDYETVTTIEHLKLRNLNEILPYSGEIDDATIENMGINNPTGIVYIKSKGVFAAQKGTKYYGDWPTSDSGPGEELYNHEFKAIPFRLYYLKGRQSELKYFDGSSFNSIEVFPQSTGENASQDNRRYIFKGATVGSNNVSTDVLADVNISTNQNSINIVGKSWGTSNWQQRCSLTAATSGKAGVMSAAQCTEHEEFVNFLSKLKTVLGTTDLDSIVSRLTD